MTTNKSDLPSTDFELNERIRQFLYYEMEILDGRDFRSWLDFFSDDLRYWMPLRRVKPPRERRFELTSSDELAVYDESKDELVQRVEKIETGKAWAEEPPSRTRHYISNVRVRAAEEGYRVRSNHLIFQGRNDRDRVFLAGERIDCIRDEPSGISGLVVYDRMFVMDDATLNVPSVSIFF